MLTHVYSLFLIMTPRTPSSTLFPYTTLFRSARAHEPEKLCACLRTSDTPLAKRKGPKRKTSKRNSRIKLTVDRKSTRLNSSHANISYAVFCLKKKKQKKKENNTTRKQPHIDT